jgi:YD repeat-containing protein
MCLRRCFDASNPKITDGVSQGLSVGSIYWGIDAAGKLVNYGSSTGRSWNAGAFGTGIAIPNGISRHVALATTYSYDNAGQLTGIVMPDATAMSYSYDSAHRLTDVTDAKGNSVTYTLDNMGNRVSEQVKDPQGNLQRSITRVYDALNQVQQTTGAKN